jgi:glycosyltransferase involved in cell wall biosynthesis
VVVIPLGYDPQVYYPLSDHQRLTLRQKKGWTDYFVFLNIGVMWNERQGIDRLLKAFAILTEIHPHIRLVLKGRDAIFPSKASIQSASKTILTDAEYERIKPKIGYIGDSLSAQEMAELYQAADCYVSPYSAEGFNLPVLEAIACGLPVICTDGGPTDDFIRSEFAWKIESKLQIKQQQNGDINYQLIPSQNHLIELMRTMIKNPHLRTKTQQLGTKYVAERYTWKHIVKQLVTVMFQ